MCSNVCDQSEIFMFLKTPKTRKSKHLQNEALFFLQIKIYSLYIRSYSGIKTFSSWGDLSSFFRIFCINQMPCGFYMEQNSWRFFPGYGNCFYKIFCISPRKRHNFVLFSAVSRWITNILTNIVRLTHYSPVLLIYTSWKHVFRGNR